MGCRISLGGEEERWFQSPRLAARQRQCIVHGVVRCGDALVRMGQNVAGDDNEPWRVDALLAVVVVVTTTATAGDVPLLSAGAGCRAKRDLAENVKGLLQR